MRNTSSTKLPIGKVKLLQKEIEESSGAEGWRTTKILGQLRLPGGGEPVRKRADEGSGYLRLVSIAFGLKSVRLGDGKLDHPVKLAMSVQNCRVATIEKDFSSASSNQLA